MTAKREASIGTATVGGRQTSGRPRRHWTPVAITGAIAATLLALCWLFSVYASWEKAEVVASWQTYLNATATDYLAGISAWVDERLGDAAMVASFPSVGVIARAAPHAAPPVRGRTSGVASHLGPILTEIVETSHYLGVAIVDTHALVRVAAGDAEDAGSVIPALLPEALRGQPSAIEFRQDRQGRAVLAAIAPIPSGPKCTPDGATPCLGAAVLFLDPQSWLMASMSGRVSRQMMARFPGKLPCAPEM